MRRDKPGPATGSGTWRHSTHAPMDARHDKGKPLPAHGPTRLVGAQWVGERRAAVCRLRSDLAGRSRSPAVEGALIEARPQRGDHNPRPALRAESSSRIN